MSRPMPGAWLRRFARLVFDADTVTRVIDPTLADLAHEVREAGDHAARRSAQLRGYFAFWKVVLISPFAFADWPGRRQFAQSITHLGAIVVLLIVTFSAQSTWMTRLLVEFYPRLQARLMSVADLGPYVWLLTPIAVGTLAALGRRSPFRAAPVAIIMICGATLTAAAAYGAAGFVAAFDEVMRDGSAGSGVLISATNALAIPTLLALGVTAAAAILAGLSQWRARRVAIANTEPAASLPATAAVVLTASMLAALIAVNQWLLFNEEMLDVGLAMSTKTGTAAAGGGAALAARSEVAVPLMLLGLVIAFTLLATAFATWRGSRTLRPSRFLEWTTRLAVIAVFAGCLWHAVVIGGQWQAFRTIATTSRAR